MPYEGDIYNVLTTANFALNNKTDWTASYSFSRADYQQQNEAVGLPLGIAYDRHGIMTGFTRRFRKI